MNAFWRVCVRAITVFILAVVALSACNMPRGNATPTVSGVGMINTAAAETVAARLTQASLPPATSAGVTLAPVATAVPATAQPTNTTAPQPTQGPAATREPPTATPVPCDVATFVKDVSYPDNTEVAASTTFIKTWRLRNSGSCTWTTGYALVFSGGDAMGAPSAVMFDERVQPGDTIDLSVTLTAPNDGGTYRGDFKLRNSSNVVFGLGDQNKPFFVQVKVPEASDIVLDFLAEAEDAEWGSGTGIGAAPSIDFDGDTDDPDGAVKILEKVEIETGAISGKVLLMVPKHDDDGFILGTFPSFRVKKGDHLRGRLGFLMNPNGKCGDGEVTFQIFYKDSPETVILVKEWDKECDGELLPVDLDLSNLHGEKIQFVLVVRAEGSIEDDWAIWNSLRIER